MLEGNTSPLQGSCLHIGQCSYEQSVFFYLGESPSFIRFISLLTCQVLKKETD